MTVKELMEFLSKQPPNRRVVVNGYEGGLSDIRTIREASILLNFSTDTFRGPHEDAENIGISGEAAVIIER